MEGASNKYILSGNVCMKSLRRTRSASAGATGKSSHATPLLSDQAIAIPRSLNLWTKEIFLTACLNTNPFGGGDISIYCRAIGRRYLDYRLGMDREIKQLAGELGIDLKEVRRAHKTAVLIDALEVATSRENAADLIGLQANSLYSACRAACISLNEHLMSRAGEQFKYAHLFEEKKP